jgi:hypothetical protein
MTGGTYSGAPLPCWSHLSPDAYRARTAKLIHQIEVDAAAQREAIPRQDPRTELYQTYVVSAQDSLSLRT